MRISGLVLMIVGIVFLLLLILARIGGGQIPATAFVVSGLIFFMGWRFRTYGKGIKQRQSQSGIGQAGPAAPTPQSPTTELALTPAVSDAMLRRAARSRRIMAIMIVCGVAFFLIMGEGIDLAVPSAGGLKALPFTAGTGLLFALIVGGIWVFTRERPIRKDLRDSTYLRTSGPVQVVPVYGGWLLRLSDRAFLADPRPAKLLAKLTWATVDYSRHAHMIFAIRDESGQIIFSELGEQ